MKNDDKEDLKWHVNRIKEHGRYEERKTMYKIIDDEIEKLDGQDLLFRPILEGIKQKIKR